MMGEKEIMKWLCIWVYIIGGEEAKILAPKFGVYNSYLEIGGMISHIVNRSSNLFTSFSFFLGYSISFILYYS